MSSNKQIAILLFATIIIYFCYYAFGNYANYASCELCDGNEYELLYNYFKTGEEAQIKFPFYQRPLVPFLASLLPFDVVSSFHLLNFVSLLLAVVTIHKLWSLLDIPLRDQIIGFVWLLFHWRGLIRLNLYDFQTVDVPLYFIQTLALILFLRNKYLWLYLLVPIAVLQKESFIGISIVFIIIHWIIEKDRPLAQGKHLILALALGLIIQNIILLILPEQLNKGSSLRTVLILAKMTWDDPSRIVRWLAAFGSAYGILPILVLSQIKRISIRNREQIALAALCLLYCFYGAFAGGDMTRILFLGFPYIMTLTLMFTRDLNSKLLVIIGVLSIVSMKIHSLPIDMKWSIDYAAMQVVWRWAAYYTLAGLVFYFIYRRFQTSPAD